MVDRRSCPLVIGGQAQNLDANPTGLAVRMQCKNVSGLCH